MHSDGVVIPTGMTTPSLSALPKLLQLLEV